MKHQYRFLVEKKQGTQEWKISKDELHHLKKVLRLTIGDQIEFFDGYGYAGSGELLNWDGDIKIISSTQHAEPAQKLAVAVGILRPSNADDLIPQLIEAGVDEIFFFLQQGTSKQYASSKVQERWARIAVSSARQCKRPFLPKFRIFNSISDMIGCVGHFCAKIQLEPDAELSLIHSDRLLQGDVCIVIGSEKGLYAEEKELLSDNNFQPCHIGQNVLRATTAAVIATGIASMRILESSALREVSP